MKVIKPKAEYLEKGVNYAQFIEKVGRVCYKSEDLITDESSIGFIKNLTKRKHFAMLEHYNAILQLTSEAYEELVTDEFYCISRKYLNCTNNGYCCVVSGSLRAWVEFLMNCIARTVDYKDNAPILINQILYTLSNRFYVLFNDVFSEYLEIPFIRNKCVGGMDSCKLISDEDVKVLYKDSPVLIMEHITHTIKFTCDRGVSHELVRHRPCAFAQENTRYCNYSKDKFGEEITVIDPYFWETQSTKFIQWRESCISAEKHYFELLKLGATPQEARSVLPNSLKTEIVVTATEREWMHILDLRLFGSTGKPHPQMQEVMKLAYPQLVTKSDNRLEG